MDASKDVTNFTSQTRCSSFYPNQNTNHKIINTLIRPLSQRLSTIPPSVVNFLKTNLNEVTSGGPSYDESLLRCICQFFVTFVDHASNEILIYSRNGNLNEESIKVSLKRQWNIDLEATRTIKRRHLNNHLDSALPTPLALLETPDSSNPNVSQIVPAGDTKKAIFNILELAKVSNKDSKLSQHNHTELSSSPPNIGDLFEFGEIQKQMLIPQDNYNFEEYSNLNLHEAESEYQGSEWNTSKIFNQLPEEEPELQVLTEIEDNDLDNNGEFFNEDLTYEENYEQQHTVQELHDPSSPSNLENIIYPSSPNFDQEPYQQPNIKENTIETFEDESLDEEDFEMALLAGLDEEDE